MTTRKTITVTDQQDAWIKAQIGAGDYTNDSEYIRDLIRRDQERSNTAAAVIYEKLAGEKAENNTELKLPSLPKVNDDKKEPYGCDFCKSCR